MNDGVSCGEREKKIEGECKCESAWNTIIKLKVPEIPRGIPSEKLP
jgi:predicted ATP-dependent serine protease